MILILHIIIALASIAWTSVPFFVPSQAKLNTSYALISGTVATGTYVAIASHAHLVQICTTGLLYLGVALSGVLVAHTRLAHVKIR